LLVFRALLNVIPTFWSTSELSQVVELYVDNCSSSPNIRFTSMTTLMKAIAKQAPAKVLLPTLCEIWPSVASASRGVRATNDEQYRKS
jgi:U3 small nucleolar RNA-associated protein 10